MTVKTNRGISSIFRTIEPNYLSFLAGAIVSTAINLYTGLIGADKVRSPLGIIVGSTLLLIASGLLTALSLKLQSLRELALTQAPDFVSPSDRESLHLGLISKSMRGLLALCFLVLVTTLGGLLVVGIAILDP